MCGVAWEEWRDCADYEAACAAGKATGGGWSKASRVLFALDSDHVIHGVSEAGGVRGVGDATGSAMVVVMLCSGEQDAWYSEMATSGASQRDLSLNLWDAFAVTGVLARQAG